MDNVIYQCGELRVDPANRRFTRGAAEIALEPKAFAVLLALLARADALVTRDELLDAVWGHRHVTPAALNRAMVLLRRAFHDDPERPRFIHTVHGAGYRFIGPVERVAVPRGTVRAHFGPPPRAQLPAKLEALIGRERELAQLKAMLSEHRAVTVIGPGGMGKTQCALEIGRQCEGDFPDGVWFFDLSPLERTQDWLRALAATLSVPIAGASTLLPRIAEALAGRKALLLIDNCDRLAVEAGVHAVELLRRCPDLKIMTTSQQRLDFVGERLMWLPQLELPPPAAEAERVHLDIIASTPAVALLLARARAVQPAISIDPGNVVDIVEICRRLDGVPLALELAAARFAMLSPAAIRERLSQRFNLLASGSAGREPRHQTMRALLEWSYGLLSAQEQRLLCWLGVFQGWTIDAAEAIGRALSIDGPRLLELHSGLILKSLAVVDPTLQPPRYRLLETVREFALQLLRTCGDEAKARTAHLQYFMQLAERSHCGFLGSHADQWLGRLSNEHANIDGALAWAKSDGRDDEAALRLAGSLMLYSKGNSLVSLLYEWVERTLDGVAPMRSPMYARVLLCRGMAELYLNDPGSEPHLAEAAQLAMQLGDRWGQGCATAFLAMWNANEGRLGPAMASAVVAVGIADAEADDWLRSLAGLAKSWVALRSGQYQEALGMLQPLRLLGHDVQQHEMIDVYLGLSHYGLGHLREAACSSLDVLERSVPWRHLRASAAAIEITAFLAMRTLRPETSVRLLGKAADIRARTRTPLFSFWIAHEEKTANVVRAELGNGRFETLYRAGASARDELVIDEARELLSGVAKGQSLGAESPLI